MADAEDCLKTFEEWENDEKPGGRQAEDEFPFQRSKLEIEIIMFSDHPNWRLQ